MRTAIHPNHFVWRDNIVDLDANQLLGIRVPYSENRKFPGATQIYGVT